MRRFLSVLGITVAALCLLVLLACALALTVEFEIPLSSHRDRITRVLSDAVGVTVTVSGPLKAYTGPRAGFEANRIHFDAVVMGRPVKVAIERLAVRVKLMPLIRGDIRVASAVAEGALICIGESAPAAPPTRSAARVNTAWQSMGIEQLQVRRIAFTTIEGCESGERMAELAALDISAPPGARINVIAQARLKSEDARFELDGPPLAAILGRSPAAPFELAATFAGTKTTVKGTANLADWSVEGNVTFAALELSQLLRSLGAPFKDLGPVQARGYLQADPSGLKVQVFNMVLAPVQWKGEFAVDWSRPRPLFSLQINAASLDLLALRDWSEKSIDPALRQPGRLKGLILDALRASDGRIAIAVGQLDAGAIDLADVVLEDTWVQGRMDARVTALVGTSPLAVSLSADLRTDAFTFSAAANAKTLALPASVGVAGALDAVDATFEGRGALETMSVTGLRAVVGVRGARFDVPTGSGTISRLNLERVDARWGERDTLSIRGNGTMAGRAVKVSAEGADATALWQRRPWTLRASGEAGPLRLQASGRLALMEGRIDADLDISARASRLTPLAPGNAAWTRLPLEAQGRLNLTERTWLVDLRRFALGNSRGRLGANGSLPPTSQATRVEGIFETLDLAEQVAPGAEAKPDDALLPQQQRLPVADVSVRASRLLLPGISLRSATLNATMRDGKLLPSAFGFELDRARVAGTIAADLTGPAAMLSVTARAKGFTERHFGKQRLPDDLRFDLGEISVSAASTGNRVHELAANADAKIGLQRAVFSLKGADGRATRTGTVEFARFSVKPGQATRLALEGELAEFPIDLEATSVALVDLLAPADLPFRVDGHVAGIDVGLQGHFPRDRSALDRLTVSISGKTLDQFNAFTDRSLPAIGPFRIGINLRKLGSDRPSGEVDFAIRESRIKGTVAKRAGGGRSRWEAELSSPLIRLEDLGSVEWLDDQMRNVSSTTRAEAPVAIDLQAKLRRAQVIHDEIRAALKRFDAHAVFAAASIRSGAEDLGHVKADVLLESGRLRAAPFVFEGPRGELTVTGAVDYGANDTPFELNLVLTRFDYGRLIRSINPASDFEGALGAKVKLTGRGTAGRIPSTLNGRLGLIVFPGSTQGVRLIELWGGGLLRNIRQGLDPDSRLPFNCGVATFDVSDGVARSRAFMLDSTRIRAAGELEVDLDSGALNGRFAAAAKRPEFFSPRLPVTVSGTLANPVVRPTAGGIAVTGIRYLLFVFAYAFDAATGKRLPLDGRPYCTSYFDALTK